MDRLRKAYYTVANRRMDKMNDVEEAMYHGLCLLHDVGVRRARARDLLDNLDADPAAMLRMSASKDNPIDTPADAVKSCVRQMRAILGMKEPA